MLEITYTGMLAVITLTWIVTRAIRGKIRQTVNWKREVMLLEVYICFVVIARIVYFPMSLVDGRIGSLFLEFDRISPLWINLIPIQPLTEEYDGWVINIIGNIVMFIPVGLVWPHCFRKLDKIWKTIFAGAALSIFIEISQLPFYDRCSDVNDVILNTAGVTIGALLYFGVKRLRERE